MLCFVQTLKISDFRSWLPSTLTPVATVCEPDGLEKFLSLLIVSVCITEKPVILGWFKRSCFETPL